MDKGHICVFLSVRASNVLNSAINLYDLQKTKTDLEIKHIMREYWSDNGDYGFTKIRNCGKKTLREITDFLQK